MEMWDGGFELAGEAPARMPSAHVPVSAVVTPATEKDMIQKIGSKGTIASSNPTAFFSMRAYFSGTDTTSLTRRMVAMWIALSLITGLSWAFPSVMHVPVEMLIAIASVLGVVALLVVIQGVLSPSRIASSTRKPTNSELTLSELCQQIRQALKQYRPNGGELYDSLVQATHRCCRITNIAGDTTDIQVIETVEMIRKRLPSILTAYQKTTEVADPEELWTAADRMAEAVIMVGNQAETARKRLLAHATDGLETEVRYVSSITDHDKDGFSSILSTVN